MLDVDTVHGHLEHLESCLKNECVLENCNLQFSTHHSYIIKDFQKLLRVKEREIESSEHALSQG